MDHLDPPNAPSVTDQSRYMNTSHLASWDTLDEPIWDTVSRDVSSIGLKLKHVLVPLSQKDIYLNVCKNWDLWGPFIFCTYIAFSLNNCGVDCNNGYHQSNFSSIFVLLWLGNIAVCLNYKLLLKRGADKLQNIAHTNGGIPIAQLYPLSIFQLLCIVGYSLAIPSMGILLVQVLNLLVSSELFYLKVLITLIFGFMYPVISILQMLSNYITSGKYFLVLYPIIMFFTVLSLYLYTFA